MPVCQSRACGACRHSNERHAEPLSRLDPRHREWRVGHVPARQGELVAESGTDRACGLGGAVRPLCRLLTRRRYSAIRFGAATRSPLRTACAMITECSSSQRRVIFDVSPLGDSATKATSPPYPRSTCRSTSLKAAFVCAPQNHRTCGASDASTAASHGCQLSSVVGEPSVVQPVQPPSADWLSHAPSVAWYQCSSREAHLSQNSAAGSNAARRTSS